jgi:hypothetical protein
MSLAAYASVAATGDPIVPRLIATFRLTFEIPKSRAPFCAMRAGMSCFKIQLQSFLGQPRRRRTSGGVATVAHLARPRQTVYGSAGFDGRVRLGHLAGAAYRQRVPRLIRPSVTELFEVAEQFVRSRVEEQFARSAGRLNRDAR